MISKKGTNPFVFNLLIVLIITTIALVGILFYIGTKYPDSIGFLSQVSTEKKTTVTNNYPKIDIEINQETLENLINDTDFRSERYPHPYINIIVEPIPTSNKQYMYVARINEEIIYAYRAEEIGEAYSLHLYFDRDYYSSKPKADFEYSINALLIKAVSRIATAQKNNRSITDQEKKAIDSAIFDQVKQYEIIKVL